MTFISLIFLVIITLGLRLYYQRLPANRRGRFLVTLAIGVIASGILIMALTHRLYLLGALFAMLLPFMRRLLPLLLRALPFLAAWRKRKRQTQTQSGKRSQVKSRLLEMELDHDTGVMYGTVLEGPMSGRELADLEDDEFIELLQYCRGQDSESARLLETYLDKRFGDKWREDDPQSGHEETEADEPEHNGQMTDAQAYEILGLEPGADRDSIIKAHRRLMQKVHPDRGGSPYLASRINAARSRLLGD